MEALRETTRKMNTFTYRVPAGSQSAFLRTMAKNMGWEQVPQPRKRTAKPKKADPTCMTKEEYFAMIDESKKQARNGEFGPTFGSAQELIEYLRTL